MDFPSHVFWTYGIEKLAIPKIADFGLSVTTSLVASALPDILETIPLLAVLITHRTKYSLKNFQEIIIYANDLMHNKPEEFRQKFPKINNLSFLVHSLVFYIFLNAIIFLIKPNLLPPFAFGYGLHLAIDAFTHNDYFSIKPFYPISEAPIKGILTWYKLKLFSKLNYLSLFILYSYLLLINF